ncbi:transcriptional regulator [Nitrosomonas ureae]|uniref:Antitoxin of toxin-antitoxin system, YdaS/YdaT n=1 Tax=Nitrosomonas ureae TaxID=44577 RepID=A0A1H2EQ89_9PROT|nr:YdaS family helix-turn-helix protein [Nitrosomonas ureae]ALQ51884.1 hypothetical protein ATY38_12050 [Nitrosomonas ureae]SDT97113.1 Putative antitoxin of toxin-antitoxin system, YdaS/YdaT [Nitrosomonas ureae]
MNLNQYLNEIENSNRFAKRIGVPLPSVSHWRHNKRQVPLAKALLIESATNGLVTRKELRPDDWQTWWPELAKKEQTDSEKAA